jgi:hypothetical protein
MRDTCPSQSFSSNSTFIKLYLYHEMVSATWLISKLFGYKCMAKTYDVNYLNMAKTYLKVLKDNCSRLRKSLSLEAFACLEG